MSESEPRIRVIKAKASGGLYEPAQLGGLRRLQRSNGRQTPSPVSLPEPAAEVGAFLRFLAGYRRQAKAEADELLTRARQQAQELVREAEAQAEAIREQARREGYEAGLIEGQRTAREQVHDEAAALLQALRTAVDTAERTREAIIEQARSDILKLALAIAEKIVRREVYTQPDVVLRLLDELLPRWEGVQRLVVRCHPDDAEAISRYLEEIRPSEADAFRVEVRPSESISRGGCVLESQFGQLDARLETRLKQTGRQLLEWLNDDS